MADQLKPICTGTKKNGDRCGMINTRRVILPDGTVTHRCRKHRADLVLAGSGGAVGRPMPSTDFKTRTDAEKFLQWVMAEGVSGRMNAAQVRAQMEAVKQFNKLRERLEQSLLDEFKELVKRANDEFKRLREIAADQVSTD